MIAMMIWLSPFVGWFLLVSAWTKRSPLLVASMPFVVLPMLERIVFGSYFFVSIFFERTVKLPLFGVGAEQKLDNIFELEELQLRPEQISLLDIIDLPQFLLHPSLWGGIIVCAGFTAGAIWIRRYRDES